MSRYMNPPIYMDCPGGGNPGNLPDGGTAYCKYCHERFFVDEAGVVPEHRTENIIEMLRRGIR